MELDDPVPVQLLDDNIYIYGMCIKYAQRFKPTEVERWVNPTTKTSLAEDEFLKNLALVKNVIDNTFTQLQPGWCRNGGGAR